MKKIFLATILIGLLAETLVKSGEALIRAGRDHVPFRTVNRDAEIVRELLNNGDHLNNFKRDRRWRNKENEARREWQDEK